MREVLWSIVLLCVSQNLYHVVFYVTTLLLFRFFCSISFLSLVNNNPEAMEWLRLMRSIWKSAYSILLFLWNGDLLRYCTCYVNQFKWLIIFILFLGGGGGKPAERKRIVEILLCFKMLLFRTVLLNDLLDKERLGRMSFTCVYLLLFTFTFTPVIHIQHCSRQRKGKSDENLFLENYFGN